jgi:hypothetical protein
MRNLVDIIIEELNCIQGEIIITKALVNEHDENIEEAFKNGDIMNEIIAIMKSGQAKDDYNNRLSYMEGQIDAYTTLLKELGLKI